MTPTCNKLSVSHEDRSIESFHGHLKSKLDDALLTPCCCAPRATSRNCRLVST